MRATMALAAQATVLAAPATAQLPSQPAQNQCCCCGDTETSTLLFATQRKGGVRGRCLFIR